MPPAKKSLSAGAPGKTLAQILDGFTYSAVALFTLMAVVLLFSASVPDRFLARPEFVTGFTIRTVLVLAGVAHLALSAFLLIAQDPVTRMSLIAWAAMNYVLYRWAVPGTAAVSPLVEVMSRQTGVKPETLDWASKSFIAYLSVGSALYLVTELRRCRRLKAETVMVNWRKARERGPASSVPAAASISANQSHSVPEKGFPTEFKFSCPSCGQHIRCETTYSGRSINCPACLKQIFVPSPEC